MVLVQCCVRVCIVNIEKWTGAFEEGAVSEMWVALEMFIQPVCTSTSSLPMLF